MNARPRRHANGAACGRASSGLECSSPAGDRHGGSWPSRKPQDDAEDQEHAADPPDRVRGDSRAREAPRARGRSQTADSRGRATASGHGGERVEVEPDDRGEDERLQRWRERSCDAARSARGGNRRGRRSRRERRRPIRRACTRRPNGEYPSWSKARPRSTIRRCELVETREREHEEQRPCGDARRDQARRPSSGARAATARAARGRTSPRRPARARDRAEESCRDNARPIAARRQRTGVRCEMRISPITWGQSAGRAVDPPVTNADQPEREADAREAEQADRNVGRRSAAGW